MRLLVVLLLTLDLAANAQAGTVVKGSIVVEDRKGAMVDSSGAVLWLTAKVPAGVLRPAAPQLFRLLQKDKKFVPHLLVAPVDSVVEFPNEDSFFHNVFSVYEGTRFDLGLYESGSSKKVRFSRPGPSYIFCNIHPTMSAVVMVMKSPYYGVTNSRGEYSIENVPAGEYTLNVWFERARPEQLKQLTRQLTLPRDSAIPTLKISEAPSLSSDHKNKFGQDYDRPTREPY